MDELAVREGDDGVTLSLRVTPRAAKNAVGGVREGRLLVSVRAVPSDGQANTAVIETLARTFGRPKSAITLVRGHNGREKVVKISGLKAQEVLEKLASL